MHPRSAHVVRSRGEGPGAGDRAPRGCGDLEGKFPAEDIRRLVWGNSGGRVWERRGLTGDEARRRPITSDPDAEARPRRRRATRRAAGGTMVACTMGEMTERAVVEVSACGHLAKPARLGEDTTYLPLSLHR